MANDNLLIAAVVGAVALVVSGIVALGGRARAAAPTPGSSLPSTSSSTTPSVPSGSSSEPSSEPDSAASSMVGPAGTVVATANGYRLVERRDDGRFAVVGTDGAIGSYDDRGAARSVANSRSSPGGFSGDAAPTLGPAVVNEWTSESVRPDDPVEQSTPADDTPSPTGPVDGPAEQVAEPSIPVDEVDDDVDYDPNVYASPDSNDLVSRDTVASSPTPDAGDSQEYGAVPEAEDDDINDVGNLSDRNAAIFDRLANADSVEEL